METFEVIILPREAQRKGASRRLRRTGQVPGIIYGGTKEPVAFSVNHNELLKHLAYEAFYSHVLTVKMGEQVERAVLKDLQRHPSRPFILHLDLQRVDDTHKLHMHIPLHFINEDQCIGTRLEGGSINHQLSEVEVRCLAKDLPEYIEIDLRDMHVGEVVHLADLKLPEGVEIPSLAQGDDHNLPVVTVHKPHGSGGADEEGAATA